MDLLSSVIHGQLTELHGQVDKLIFGTKGFNYFHCKRYTLSSVLVEFSKEMCPDVEGGCSFSKQGLLQTALVIVYLMV